MTTGVWEFQPKREGDIYERAACFGQAQPCQVCFLFSKCAKEILKWARKGGCAARRELYTHQLTVQSFTSRLAVLLQKQSAPSFDIMSFCPCFCHSMDRLENYNPPRGSSFHKTRSSSIFNRAFCWHTESYRNSLPEWRADTKTRTSVARHGPQQKRFRETAGSTHGSFSWNFWNRRVGGDWCQKPEAERPLYRFTEAESTQRSHGTRASGFQIIGSPQITFWTRELLYTLLTSRP